MVNKIFVVSSIIIIVALITFFSISDKTLAMTGDCNQFCSDTINNDNHLTTSYEISNKTFEEEILNLTRVLNETIQDRDYYKNLYENSSIGKISVRDFYLNINNSINNYNDKIQTLNQNINNNFVIIWVSLALTVSIEIIIVLFSAEIRNKIIPIFNGSKSKSKGT